MIPCALVGALALAATATAQNTTKSSSTNSCPSQQSVMTSNWYGATSTPSGSYLCAQEYHEGDVNVGMLDTSTFAINTNVAYFPTYHCWSTTDDKAFSIAEFEIFGSASVSATNWDDTNHHWGAGWLFTLGSGSVSGFTNGCKSTTDQVWEVPPSILTLSSISASGLPDNGASKAGVPYTVTVNASPTTNVSGYQAVLQDNGQNVAVGTFDSGGSATIKWTPAEMGSRKIQVAWPGNGDTMGNITDAYTVDVAGGMAVKFDTTPALGANNAVAVKVDLDTSPDAFPSGASVVLIDAATQKALAAPAAVTPPSSGYSTSVNFNFIAATGKRYKLMAVVRDSSGAVIGQSYVSPLNVPSVLTATVPGTAYVGNSSNCPTVAVGAALAPSTGTGTVTFTAGGSTATGSLVNGSATIAWCPPATAGTYSWTMSYGGDAATTPSSASGKITVVGGAPSISISGTSVTQKAPSATASGSATSTVKGTIAGGTVNMTNDGSGTMGTATSAAGSTSVSFSFAPGYTYGLVAALVINQQTFLSPAIVWTGPPASNSKPGPGPQPLAAMRTPRPTVPARSGMSREDRAHEAGRSRRAPGGNPGRAQPPDEMQPVNTGALTFTRSRKVTMRTRSVSLNCPRGYAPLHAEGMGSGPATRYSVSFSGRKAVVTSPAQNVGETMSGHLMCRASSSAASVIGPLALGTRRADALALTAANGTAFAGPGRDRVRATGANSVAWGGFGNDRIVVAGKDSVGAGGPGRDRLLAVGATRMLLIGGHGPDVLVGGRGPTHINALDGKAHDRIVCRSAANRVLIDAGDSMTGPCRVLSPPASSGGASITMEPTKPMSR